MTPAQLDALSGVELRAMDPDARRAAAAPAPAGPSDGLEWLALASLANGG